MIIVTMYKIRYLKISECSEYGSKHDLQNNALPKEVILVQKNLAVQN